MKKSCDYREITEEQLKKEIGRSEHRLKYKTVFKRTVSGMVTIAAAAVLIATLWFPVYRVTGHTMEPLLINGQFVLGFRTGNLARGDIGAFYYENRIVLRRVVAQAGDWLRVDGQGKLTVNGERLDGISAKNPVLEKENLTYPYQVPDGCCIVKADTDVSGIHFVSAEKIAAKVVLIIWPLHQITYFG